MSLVNLFRQSDPPPEPAAAPDALIAERDRAMAALNRIPAAFGARVGEAQGAADRATSSCASSWRQRRRRWRSGRRAVTASAKARSGEARRACRGMRCGGARIRRGGGGARRGRAGLFAGAGGCWRGPASP